MRELSIYIHIPFCVRKCLYCDFLSAPAGREEIESYVNLLLREIKKQSIFYGDHRVISIFLGGGTPSLLPAADVERILEQIRRCYPVAADAEITIECNPGTVTAEKLQHYITGGINRLSVGLQSTDDAELARIGRIHSYRDFLESYRLAREAGFGNINVDLMAALPGQSVDSYRRTLERVTALAPEHISAYSLILEEGTPLYVNRSSYTFPTEEEDREMYVLTGKYLEEAGYRRYEISNYAREGFACRHNRVYWRRGDYAGFGLGASSMVGNVRWKNPEKYASYAAYVEQAEKREADEVQVLTAQEQMEEFMFLGLRMTSGISAEEFAACFGRNPEDVYGEVIRKNIRDGLLKWAEGLSGNSSDRRLALTEKGLDLANYVMAQFLF